MFDRELGLWVALMIGFEALGFALAFAIGAGIHAAWTRAAGLPADADMPLLATIALSLVVGGVEGSLLATGQWLRLRHRIAELRWSSWAAGTGLGGGLAWVLGMSLGPHVPADLPTWMIPVLVVSSGMIFGALLGSCQWLVLRSHVDRSGLWIAANSIGWMLGLIAVYLGMALDVAGPAAIAVSVLSGAVMAITPAVLTGVVLRRIAPMRDHTAPTARLPRSDPEQA
ncbi:hypothetical protein ACNOYE_28735 [Nannocystaceae bacterium ST9]